jgi:hypothetical protein
MILCLRTAVDECFKAFKPDAIRLLHLCVRGWRKSYGIATSTDGRECSGAPLGALFLCENQESVKVHRDYFWRVQTAVLCTDTAANGRSCLG